MPINSVVTAGLVGVYLPYFLGGGVTETQVRECLEAVIDPELGVNIVDLGLIYRVEVREKDNPKVKIVMTLTSPGCPLAGSFDGMVRDALRVLPGLDVEDDVEIELTFDPPWTPELMSEQVKADLGYGEFW